MSVRAVKDPPKGGEDNPWEVGSPTAADVKAWTNGTGRLVVEGSGAMQDFEEDAAAPWYSERATITTVKIGSGVTHIGSFAFYNCQTMASVTIPSSVTSIGVRAFGDCYGVAELRIDSIESWCKVSIEVGDAVDGPFAASTVSEKKLYVGGAEVPTTALAIPDGIKTVNECAFVFFGMLTSVTIPSSVTSIGNNAFDRCSGLTSVTISEGVTNIGGAAFYNCSGLTSVTIPSSVTSVGNSAFSECSGLTSVTMLEGLPSIAPSMFAACSNLKSVTIPASVTNIGNQAFQLCTGLTSVTIPSSVTSIGWNAFAECAGLTSVTIPASVTNIGNLAFNSCSALKYIVEMREQPPTAGTNIFGHQKSPSFKGRTIYVSPTSVETYKGAVGWSIYEPFIKSWLPTVEYLDWDDEKKEMYSVTCMAYDVVTNGMDVFEAGRTYMVTNDVVCTKSIAVEGTEANPTRLILCDGAKLVAEKGIQVTADGATTNAIVICGQTLGTGVLEATGDDNCAGIGSVSMVGPGGSVTINGGTVTATGTNNGAGIGGGRMGGGGSVTINGGTVTATGDNGGGAGIGGGYEGDGGSVTINGGRVVANGGFGAAGIGGGWVLGVGGSVKINGGTVTATGSYGGAAIGIGGDNSSPDAGTVTFGAGKWIVKQGDVAPGTNTTAEAYAADHSAKYAHIGPLPPVGCEDNPWEVGGTDGTGDLVEAWTNGTELVVQGVGSVTNLADVVKDGITAINVTDATVTGAASEAFKGFSNVALSLPDGWQGELPGEGGNWYGALIDMEKFVVPLAVKNVTFQQRYPWNGKVDIGFGVTGPEGEKNVVITVRDGETEVTNFTAAVTIPAGGLLATNLVWDAEAAGLAANFKSDRITIEVALVPPPAVQLWADGPYFATCNVGANEPWECGYYFWWGDTVGYTNTNPSGEGQWVSVDGENKTISFSQSDTTANQTYDKDLAALYNGGNGYIDAADENGKLKPEYDAATAHWKGPWRMPTADEVATLADEKVCQRTWVENYNDKVGVNGYVVRGKAGTPYANNEVFFPAAGYGIDSRFPQLGSVANYGSSTPSSSFDYAWILQFYSGAFRQYSVSRFYGRSVRAVRDAASAVPAISAKSEAGALDLTVGDRVAKDTETLVVDPACGHASEATVAIDFGGETVDTRTYTCATNDTWDTTELTPGRYTLALTVGAETGDAAFWKTGDDWVVFNSSNVTADVTFEADKTYLMLGTNTVAGTLKVTDGAKFEYGEGAGFLGGTFAEPLPKRYEQKDLEGGLYQIVEKIKGCEDNPWEVGEGVEAWTNGTELVVQGAGTVAALTGVDGLNDLLAGLTAINVTSNGVTGATSDAFAGIGTEAVPVELTLPDGWQGELPGEGGNWYGALIDMDNFVVPLAVKNVTFQQRYPWNGKVDVSCDLTGAGSVTLNVTVFTNGVKLCEATALAGETTVDLDAADGVKNGVKFVWDAAADLPAGFKAQGVKIKVTVKKYVPPPPKQHTVDVTLKSQSGAPVAGKVVFHLETGASAEISIGDDGTGRGEVPEGKGTWTVDAKYCATTPTTPTESTIDQDGLTIDLTVQRQTKNVDVVALFWNHSSHPPVPNASITWVLSDGFVHYGEEITVTADGDGKAQFKNVELGLGLEVWGEGSFYDPDFDGGWTYDLECEAWFGPDEISEGGVKELYFEDVGGV